MFNCSEFGTIKVGIFHFPIHLELNANEGNPAFILKWSNSSTLKMCISTKTDFGDGLTVDKLKNFRRFYFIYADQEKSYTLGSLLTCNQLPELQT